MGKGVALIKPHLKPEEKESGKWHIRDPKVHQEVVNEILEFSTQMVMM